MTSHNLTTIAIPVDGTRSTGCSCTTVQCCKLGIFDGMSPTDLLMAMPYQSSDEKKTRETFKRTIDRYTTLDTRFLYTLTFAVIATLFALIVTIHKSPDCSMLIDSTYSIIIWFGVLAICTVAARLYFFNMYIQHQILSIIGLRKPTCTDKTVNIIFYMLVLSNFALFVVMFFYNIKQNMQNCVIVLGVLVVDSMITTGWFKLIVRRNIRIAYNEIVSTGETSQA
jgi:hypothetical protein